MKKLLLSAFAILGCAHYSLGQTVPNYLPTDSLIAWWPFTGNALDSSGNGNHGTVNTATLTTDRFGIPNHAFFYSSIGCATRIEASVNTSKIKNGLTISVWVMKVGDGCVAPRFLDFNNSIPGVSLSAGSAEWEAKYGSVTSDGSIVSALISPRPVGTWTHLVYTNDRIWGRFYQDGVLITSVASSGFPTLGGNLSIGRMNRSSWNSYNGSIDDIGIWNRALSACEISKLYLASNTFFTSKPANQAVKIGASASFTIKDTLGSSASYQWQENTGTGFVNLTNTSPYSGVNTKTLDINPVVAGMHNNQYRCIRNSGSSCLDTSAAAILTLSNLSIKANQLEGLTIRPNPVHNSLNINAPATINKLVLYNTLGQLIFESKPHTKTASIDMSVYPAGMYILKLNDEWVEKIIKE